VVESERSLKCESGGTKISATLSALDQRVNAHLKRPKRRENAHALRKLRETKNKHLAAFRTNCFWSAMRPRIAFILQAL
jgi:hypothetical protein